MTGTDDESFAVRKEANDWVVSLVAYDVAEFASSASFVVVGVGDLEFSYLACVDTGPSSVI